MADAVIQSPSVDPTEAPYIVHHSNHWWDDKGEYKAQILYDRRVVPFYIDEIANNTGLAKPEYKNSSRPFKGLKVLEVGCGGGIIGELMGKTGCSYVGIDVNKVVIEVARNHLQLDPTIRDNVQYLLTSVEEHAEKNPEKYDVIIINTVIAHVLNPELFLKSCTNCLKPGGSIFISSVNKTWMGWLVGIVLAEGIFKTVPKDSHKWHRLTSTTSLTTILKKYQCKTVKIRGVMYNLLRDDWYLTDNDYPFFVFHASKDI